RCLPASEVGGDFFQYFERDGKLSLCLADVTGHAMEAAVPVMMFSGVLETEMQYGHSVERLLTQLNQLLHRKLDRRTFICFAIGEVHLQSRLLRLSNVGCPPLYHYRQATGRGVELEGGGYPLGVQPEGVYAATEIALGPGDRIVFCSDGLVEAANVQEEIFGFDQVAESIRQGCADDLSAAALIDRLIGAVQDFSGDVSQADDMTCVVLKVNTQG
ncbi:MAG: serine/threonine-protein phosphatase, partial [Gemmatimonadetes bacterium]|nr:serine/threonine-protein phosphatase [Gemmatimonadota bacterium]